MCCRCVVALQEELKILRQQQADYVDHIQHFSDREAHQAALFSVHNAEGKYIITSYLHVTSRYIFLI